MIDWLVRFERTYGSLVASFALGAITSELYRKYITDKKVSSAEVVSSDPLMTRNMTPADYEEAYVESSGTTADIVPVSLSQSFVGSYLGKQVMDLQNTTRTFNDSLTSGPITDVEAFYENPFVADQ
jgi:hypothetical protein